MFKTLVSTRFIAPLFILLEITGLLLIHRDYDNRISNIKQFRIQSLRNQYNATLNSYSLLTNTIFDEVIDQPEVLALVKKADDAKNDQMKAIYADSYLQNSTTLIKDLQTGIFGNFISSSLTGRAFLDFIFPPNSVIIFSRIAHQ